MIARFKQYPEVVLFFGICFVVVGTVVAVNLPDLRQRVRALTTPIQTATLQEALDEPPADYRYVEVTDFTLGGGFVYEVYVKKGQAAPRVDATTGGKIWVPLRPRALDLPAGDDPLPAPFPVVFEPEGQTTTVDLRLLTRRQKIQGLLMSPAKGSLTSETKRHLAEQYPDTDFDRCLVLRQCGPREAEGAPASEHTLTTVAAVALAAGLPILLLGVLGVRAKWRAGRRRREPPPLPN